MKKIIHVNQHIIKSNKKNNRNDPPLTIKTYKSNHKGHEVIIYDKYGNEVCRIVNRPKNPLSCGAVVWLETENKVEVI